MNFTREELEKYGFEGFVRVVELKKTSCNAVPRQKGVYVIYKESSSPSFLHDSIGGHFKGRNPSVSFDELESNWIKGAKVVYIGKAGGSGSSATLYSRLKQYMRFGEGKPVGHWGGRYIWQLEDSDTLLVAWKILSDEEPEAVETDLINDFRAKYGKRPFANLSK